MKKEWLIRTPELKFRRPVDEATLIGMIERGELSPQDEICRSADYWFYLSDTSEIRSHLGEINLERLFPKSRNENTSSTDTHQLNQTKLLQPEDIELETPIQTTPAGSSKMASPSERREEPSRAEYRGPERRRNAVSAAPASSVSQEAKPDADSDRIGNTIFFSVLFLLFFLTLIWLWSGSY